MSLPRRSAVLVSLAVLLVVQGGPAHAQGAHATAAREAMANYVATWNRHNTAEWADLLADDVWYHDSTDRVQRMRGKETVLKFFGDLVTTSDIQWEVVRIKEMPDGTVSAVVRHFSGVLPKINGKYNSSFESNPAFTRWRQSGNSWRMFYFTSHKGSALDAMRKDGLE